MPWKPLNQFDDAAIPKLNNLRQAVAAKLRVPTTWWARGEEVRSSAVLTSLQGCAFPLIVRSGSPTEDTRLTSNAGQLLSLPVREPADFADSARRVVDALPRDASGRSLGVVFVQPLVAAEEAGVAFYDGFYYERTQSRGSNEGLTSGLERGEVRRGHWNRDDAWSAFLASVYGVFGLPRGDPRLDLEFARDQGGYILLQVRPALFSVARNPTLSLANHKEILGDPPSRWMVSALVEAGKDLSFPALADPQIARWDEAYAVEAGERAWLNLSFWYRWMDHFGLPRSMVTEGVGGQTEGPADERLMLPRFLRSIPRLMWFQLCCLGTLPTLKREFRRLDRAIASAAGLPSLHAATADGLRLALRGNFAINAFLSGASRMRRLLRIGGKARVVTQEMMDDYQALRRVPIEKREAALDRWLKDYGHRGPLESELSRPRFIELRDVLWADLQTGPELPSSSEAPAAAKHGGWSSIFWKIDETREWFRDEMMRRWLTLRRRIRSEASRWTESGKLESPDDIFFLRPSDFGSPDPKAAVSRAKQDWQRAANVAVPSTASLDDIRRLMVESMLNEATAEARTMFPGIALTTQNVEGRAVKANDLVALLKREATESVLTPAAILVVPTLEPSWAVVFGRVGGVVAEMGGELSHASILLREARKAAIVNCHGIFAQVRDGDMIRLNSAMQTVEIVRY
jgi:phosphohistidine swiveling domain-containing protein